MLEKLSEMRSMPDQYPCDLVSRLDFHQLSSLLGACKGACESLYRVSRPSARNLLEVYEAPSDLLARPTGKNSTVPIQLVIHVHSVKIPEVRHLAISY